MPTNTVQDRVSGLRETTSNYTNEAGRGLTRTAAGTAATILHRNLVKHGVLETTCLTNPFKTSCQARFARFRAPTSVGALVEEGGDRPGGSLFQVWAAVPTRYIPR